MFKETLWKREMVKDLDKIPNRNLRETHERRKSNLTSGVEIYEGISMGRSFRRGSTIESPNMGLDGVVVEANKR